MKKLSKNEWVAVTVSLFVVGFFFIFGQSLLSFFSGNKLASTDVQNTQLSRQDIVIGAGEQATVGSRVVVHYTGKLPDGTVFDSSVQRNEPFPFVLGDERLIKGWNQGIVGMRVGGKRLLFIPSELAYGMEGVPGVIPANTPLIFEVELIKVDSAE